MNNCKTCGARCEKEYCFKHSRKKPLKTSSLKKKSNRDIITNSGVPNGEGIYNNIKMKDFFLEVWNTLPHICIVTGEKIYGECKSIYLHHILPKKKFPQAQYDPENIAILLPDIHGNVENDIYRYEIINEKRELLLTKYNLK